MTGPRARAAERGYFGGLFASIADEMLEALVRTAYSPNIKERRDCSAAVFDGTGRLVAQAAAIPVHLGAMPMSVEAAIADIETWAQGDVVALNDPFRGGTHLPDLTMVSPVFAPSNRSGSETTALSRMTPFAFLATRAHHADMGGLSPGSMPLSREIYQEGLRLPPVRLFEAGRENRDVWTILLANVRTPEERRGDLRAQSAAHEVGSARLAEAAARHGAPMLEDRMADLQDYGETLMRAVIRWIPDGEYVFEDALDGDGVVDERVPIRVRVAISGDEAIVDFTGSAPACEGCVNAVEAITRSAVDYCFLCLLATPWRGESSFQTDPPLNGGCFRPIGVFAPEGTVVNARPPRAVAAGNVETSQRIVDVVLGALSQALPEVIPAASQGTMNNLTLGGLDPRREAPFAFYETIAGGTGAGPDQEGLDGVHSHMTNTRNTPVEALEFAYPLRVERYEIRRGSGGEGSHRGGCGLVREIRALCPVRGSLLADRRATRPYGLAGGEPGLAGRDTLVRDGHETPLASKIALDLSPGDVVRIESPGGGGWGVRP